ncbi:hypothetical protein ACFCWY_36210 [Streptomyces sp. NPDC056362]|uniref:hypothetical protein n=1 Tax=unclassified Streptomyces TaxID=2593676 RepID=UPI0035E0518D
MLPRASNAPVPTRTRSAKSAIEAILGAAAELRPTPGYINGTDYDDWFVEATPGLLRALADLAQLHKEGELADDLRRFSGPMCLEPLYDDPSDNSSPRSFCAAVVARKGEPCSEHSPANAAALGRCVYTDRPRLCRGPRVQGKDRCAGHVELCLVIQLDGTVCGRRTCKVPKHKRMAEASAREAAAVPASS